MSAVRQRVGWSSRAVRQGDLPTGRIWCPALNPQPQDHRVTKRSWGAFTATDLDVYLKQRGVTQVVIAGIATSMGVESTARQAHELGYNVTLATDAMTDTSVDVHLNSLTRVFPKIAETGSTQAIIELLGHPLA